ncbi:MAG: EVE domain-containing protein, partial [Akkermansiaceae bacterium]|nr:EVE domain-containing protein [Armatimonadota bacterium]
MPQYWLIKSEPHEYSISDLENDRITCWDGVRNYQARNFMRDGMKVGDRLLFYHSNATPSAIVGLAEVVRLAYPDHTAWEVGNAHYDPRSTPENPLWLMVDVGYIATFAHSIPLASVKADPILSGMTLAQKGSRLSVHPVSQV